MIQPVVLCGGSSRTLLHETAVRCHGLPVAEPIIVSKDRGTAPALTLAAVHAVTADDPVLLAMPSDHFVLQRGAFQRAVERGAALACRGTIVAFGVPPAAPQTGYGYIRARSEYVQDFVANPDAATAKEYFDSGQSLWNAGIFAVRASVWIEAIGGLRPDIFKACERAYRQGKRDGAFLRVDMAAFAACPADSIDCAVMEKIAGASAGVEAMVVRLDAGWCRFEDAYDRTAA